MKEELLKCGICGDLFQCNHKMVNEAYSQKLKVPHCLFCFFDDGKCEDKHGYQCPKCQQLYPQLNPQTP